LQHQLAVHHHKIQAAAAIPAQLEKLVRLVKHDYPNKTAIKDSADCKYNKINR
jgi:hypothetical protein